MVGEVLTEGKEPPTLTEIFEEQCPYYMAMGMSVSEFWDGEPILAKYYRKAFEIRQDMLNAWEWRMGAYNLSAFGTVLGNAFRKKGERPTEYLAEPLPLREKTEEQKQAEIKAKTDKFASALEKGMARFNARKAKENENGSC